MSPRRVLLAGATGLIGKALAELLTQGDSRVALTMVSRREVPGFNALSSPHRVVIAPDLMALTPAEVTGPIDAYACCLGTTIKKAGSREAFRAIDLDLVLHLARVSRDAGATHAVVVSSVGASPGSMVYYNRIKGQMEQAMEALGFDALDIIQPGLLLGQREEHRPAEALASKLLPWLNPALPASYRAIEGQQVAQAIAHMLRQPSPLPGTRRHLGAALLQAAAAHQRAV